MNTFKELGIAPSLLKVIEEKQFEQPTSIQRKSIPILEAKKNILATAQTGSGKTLCYIARAFSLAQKGRGIQVLIVAPTRQLAEQIEKMFHEFNTYNSLSIKGSYGGSSYKQQTKNAIEDEIVIGTTGRISDLIEQGLISNSNLKLFCLDEFDEMLQSQYLKELEYIFKHIPKRTQKAFFSATLSQEANSLIKHYFDIHKKVEVQKYLSPKKLKQEIIEIEADKKLSLLVHILETRPIGKFLIFANRQDTVEWLEKNLKKLTPFKFEQLHSDMTPGKRRKAFERIINNKCDGIIATDVAARGLDIEDISHVINFNLPKKSDNYIHRIGRTARAGKQGVVISFVTNNDIQTFLSLLKEHDIYPIFKDTPEFREVEEIKPFKRKKPRR